MPGNPNERGRCHSGKRPKASVKLRFSGTTAEPSLDSSDEALLGLDVKPA